MPPTPTNGTASHTNEAGTLGKRYESISFADVHRPVLHLMPANPYDVLDIGASTGRDAAALAAMGRQVVTVEPTAALRRHAATLHPSPRITWLDDSLPELAVVRAGARRSTS